MNEIFYTHEFNFNYIYLITYLTYSSRETYSSDLICLTLFNLFNLNLLNSFSFGQIINLYTRNPKQSIPI